MAEFYKVCSLKSGNLFVMPKPGKVGTASEDIADFKEGGIDVVVSLLQLDEQSAEGLDTEAGICAELGLEFLSFPVVDHCVPADRVVAMDFVSKLKSRLEQGKGVGIHCRGGVGRTGTIAGALMVACGFEASDAFEHLTRARGKRMPATDAQRDWVAHT